MKSNPYDHAPVWRSLARRSALALLALLAITLEVPVAVAATPDCRDTAMAGQRPGCTTAKPAALATARADAKSRRTAHGKASTRVQAKRKARSGHGASAAGKVAAIRYQEPSQASPALAADARESPSPGRPGIYPQGPCFAALGASNAGRHLAARLPLFGSAAEHAQWQHNPGRVSKNEKTELNSVVAGYEMCLDMTAEQRRASLSPQALALQNAHWQRTKAILGDLQKGQLSFGEAARAMADNDQSMGAKLEALVAERTAPAAPPEQPAQLPSAPGAAAPQ